MAMAQNSSDFSFDLYPNLDRDLDDIYQRNVAGGGVSAEAAAADGLQAAIDSVVPPQPNALRITPEAKAWAEQELDLDTVYNWYRYNDSATQLDITPLFAFEHGPDGEPTVGVDIEHFAAKIEKLFQAKQALATSGELSVDGENIAKTMHLVAIPWKAFRDNLHRLPDFIKPMREVQAEAAGIDDIADDDLNGFLLKAIQDGTRMYRNPIAGHVYTTTTRMPMEPDWISAAKYLDYRISRDGDWGLMLAQTSVDAGIKRLDDGPDEQRSPDVLTNYGQDEFEVASQRVGQMGIFEWLSLTLQAENPDRLSIDNGSWLLANRLEINDALPCLPLGTWDDDKVKSDLQHAQSGIKGWYPRLAVVAGIR